MKNNLFKKSMSVFLSVLMIMSCWVFVPGEHNHAEAAALEAASSLYNKSLLNGINTNVDYNVNTTGNYYKFKIYGNGDDGNDNTPERQQKYYKNVLSHDAGTSMVGDNNRGSYFTNVTNSELTVSIAYPTMVLKYDGVTTPKFGIMLEADSTSGKTVRFERAWMDANSNGLSFNPNYWLGIANDDSAYFYCMDVADHKYTLRAQDTNQGGVFNARKNGQWEFLAASLEFTGSMSIGEWTRTISPTWKFSNGSTTYTGTNTSTIYVMNFKGYGELLTRINNHKNELLANAGQYTTDSVKTYVDAAKAIINLNPKNYTGTNQASSWGSQMNTAYTNYNNAVNGLTKRQYEVTYDNMFSLADWRYSQSYEKSGVSVDLNAGKVTVKHPSDSGEYVTTHSGSSSNSGTRNTNLYAMPVVGGQEYTMKYTTDGESTEMFAFFYDKNGGCTHEGSSFGAYNFTVAKGTGERTVKVPDNSTHMEIRFDNNTPNSTANFWDIMIYPAAVKTENEVDTWTARPHRQLYTYGASVGTLQTPARPGYNFGGWKEDTNGDGIGDADITGTITSSRVLYSTWTPGTMDVGYDNLFSLSAWANSNSSVASNTNRGSIAYDLDAGTITAITTKDGEVYSNYGSAAGHYQMAVEPNTEYIFTADVDLEGTGKQGQMFVFFYDASGAGVTGAIQNGSTITSPHIGNYVTTEGLNYIAFTTPSNCTKMSVRFGATVVPTTAVYSNIGFYKKAAYDAYAKDYEKVREPFIIGDTKNLMNPTREGYVFEGWELEDGTKITTTAGLTANTTVYAVWTKEHTVTYYYGDNTTVLATVKVKDGKTVGSLPSVVPTKETTDEYEYKFDHWYANSAEFKADTVITSDVSVYPEFNEIAHNFIWADYTVADATCTAAALVNRYCADCYYDLGNFTYTGDNAEWLALGHEFDADDILRNSDQGDGNHLIKCVRYSDCNTTKAAEHIWAGNDSQGATCVIPGKIKQICPCGATQTIDGELDNTNHVHQSLVGVEAPDCENDGYTGDLTCDDCGALIEKGAVDPKLGHSFTKYESDGNATCTADGTETAYCDRDGCGAKDTRTVEGSKLDHTFTNYVYNNDAKCGVDGTKTAECDTCDTGATDTITAEGTALTHNFNGEIKNNNDGTHSYKCTNKDCEVYGGTTDCTYGEWDTSDSYKHVATCTACGYKLEGEHKWTQWATTDEYKQADGTHKRGCTVCYKEVEKNCTYTRRSYAETCTKDGYTRHSCNDCGHNYQTPDKGKTGHDYTGEVKSYNNGQHSFLCKNGCGTYGYAGVESARTTCTYEYENTASGAHKATCTACAYSFTEDCSGGQATCTEKAECTKCNTVYGETVPHSFTGTVIALEGDKHAFLCEYCETPGLYGVFEHEGETEVCFGGEATCTALAICNECEEGYGSFAPHTFDGDAVKLDGDVHAYRCSVCKDDTLYGVGTTINDTEACSGGKATCTDLAVCDKCEDTHGELDPFEHKYSDKCVNVEGENEHKYICEYNSEHYYLESCTDLTFTYVKADCEAEGYTINTCGKCGHSWKDDIKSPVGHKWSASVSNKDGTHTRTCEREGCHYGTDGAAKVETANCKDSVSMSNTAAPNCTSKGYTRYWCGDCQYEWVDDYVDPTGHHYEEKKKKTGDTYLRSSKNCTTDLTYWYCCDDCNVSAGTEKDKYENEADLYWVSEPAAGHVSAMIQDEKYLYSEATCTVAAVYYYACKNCGEVLKSGQYQYGSKLGHDWTETETYLKSEADCINNEVYYKECSRCHYSSQNLGDETWEKADTKSGHDFKDGYTKGVAATCTEDGVVEHYTCKVCNKHFKADKTTEIAADKLTIAALKHDFKDVAAKPATCEEDGYTKHKQCQREGCGYRNTDYKVIPALGHEFKAENGYYTDTAIGYHAYKCSNCDAYGVDKVKYSAEYDGLDWIVVGGIKCEFTGEYVNYDDANGIHSHKLNCVCGNEQSAACADADPKHEAPTCTENGYYVHTCDVCSFEWTVASDAEEDKATGHNFEGAEWTQVAGKDEHTRKCNNCDETQTEACATANPSTSCGSQNECDKCHQPFGEQIPHTWEEVKDEAYLKSAANCTDDAVYFKKCASCDNKDEKQIWVDEGSAIGHKMTEDYTYDLSAWKGMPEDFDKESIKKPTCHSEGLSITYCTNADCDFYKTKSEKADSTAHVWPEEWTEVGGDCANGLTMVRKCTAEGCNAVQSKTEKVPHSWDEIVRVEADCTHAGYSHYKCTACGFVQIVDEAYELLDEEGNVVEEYPTFNGKDTGHKAALGHDYSAEMVVEKAATCGKDGRGYHVCQRCNEAGDKEVIPATGHDWDKNNDGITDEGFVPSMIDAKTTLYVEPVESTCQIDGHNGYYKCFNCSYDQSTFENWKKDNFFGKTEHADDDNDGKCDECNSQFYGEDGEKNCGCICHKEGWFMKFIYKIIRFFWKLFGIGKACECGTVHY